jgi:hypothetical protein
VGQVTFQHISVKIDELVVQWRWTLLAACAGARRRVESLKGDGPKRHTKQRLETHQLHNVKPAVRDVWRLSMGRISYLVLLCLPLRFLGYDLGGMEIDLKTKHGIEDSTHISQETLQRIIAGAEKGDRGRVH